MSIIELSNERREVLLQAGRNRLLNFCQLLNKDFETEWFHEIIAEKLQNALEAVQNGKKIRIILSIPPRHGKSTIASQYFPAWALGKYPNTKFILSTYGADLAEKMGLATRDIINHPSYQTFFPGITLRPDVKAKAVWAIAKTEGGRASYPGGSYTAVGIGGAITGIGASVVIMDDPHKDRAEAESELARENVWEYYRSTLYSRIEGFGAVIIIMQRWHADDLVGRLIEDSKNKKDAGLPYDEWDIVNFPAIADKDDEYNGKVVRRAGEALWPSRFPVQVLENIKSTAGVYNWASQYLQDPILAEHQEFKQTLFKYHDEDLSKKYLAYYTVVDPAISQKKSADNTVVLTIAKEVNGPNIYRVREDAGHFTPQQTVDLIFVHQNDYRSSVHIETVQYQKALKYAVQEQQRKIGKYFIVDEIKTDTNKELRIRGLLPLYDAGVILHKKTDVEYEHELLAFPRGRHDDRADAMAMGIGCLGQTGGARATVNKKKIKGYFKR